MGLLSKIFGTRQAPAAGTSSSHFHDGDANSEQFSRNTPRRELVQVVLRDTMRRHGIPSDWLDCRILSVVSRSKTSGMHVHLVVRQGHDRLLAYVPAFQRSFMAELERFEPRCAEWLLSLSWQFVELTEASGPEMPAPGTWTAAAAATAGGAAAAAASAEGPSRAGAGAGHEEEVLQDLEALFAIRDAALSTLSPLDMPDFEPTRPGFDHSGSDLPRNS